MTYNSPTFTPAGILGLGLSATATMISAGLLQYGRFLPRALRASSRRLSVPRARAFSEPVSAPLDDPMHGAHPGVVMASTVVSSTSNDKDATEAGPITEETHAPHDGKTDKAADPDAKQTPPDRAEPLVEHNHDHKDD
ncbi:hypothetical protein [Pseudooceanicola algae]|uniref:Uncharacterized protein n=1 Tax=Pseudooceanicola algae TaxID=1537215 RepID=A0A418SDE2_9RHOB|nr:hypothetical protein [Pseudooceanicola algae]QPM91058.1 hypothetical protein PSAL_023010 [Pseudooceanicola algae]